MCQLRQDFLIYQGMNDNWKIRKPKSDFQRDFPGLEKTTEIILKSRGLAAEDEVDRFFCPDFENIPDPFLMADMDKAVAAVLDAKSSNKLVCIYGDYDADGVASSVLLQNLFGQMGIRNFCYIPERNNEGYGLNKNAIEYIASKKADLVVTVDCGISNFEEAKLLAQKNIELVILDHHHVPETIPEARAVVNPKRKGDKYPEKNLAGVGVAFKFAQALAEKHKKFDKEQLKWLLDLVAIGTIADCVPLLGENRTLAKFGLIVLAKTKRVGLRQIYQVGRINIDESNLPGSFEVAFQIAPRINAAGRMDHANVAFELLGLDSGQEPRARELALELEAQNQQRQKATKYIVEEVEKKVARHKKIPKIIIESSPHWELGIIGLAAGKIADKYHRPCLLFQDKGEFSKGSGRSIKQFNLIETLEQKKDLLEKYGGHSQAAGMTIKNKNLDEFKKEILQEAEKHLDDNLVKQIEIECEILLSEINEKLVSEIELMEPFGQDNKEPVFISSNVEIVECRLVGNGEKHLKLRLKDPESGIVFEAIGFGLGAKNPNLKIGEKINVAYNISKDSWNGRERIQLKIIDLEVLVPAT